MSAGNLKCSHREATKIPRAISNGVVVMCWRPNWSHSFFIGEGINKGFLAMMFWRLKENYLIWRPIYMQMNSLLLAREGLFLLMIYRRGIAIMRSLFFFRDALEVRVFPLFKILQ